MEEEECGEKLYVRRAFVLGEQNNTTEICINTLLNERKEKKVDATKIAPESKVKKYGHTQ